MDEKQQNELKPTDNADQTYELKRINKKLNDTLFHLEKMHKYILVMLIMAAVVILPINFALKSRSFWDCKILCLPARH